MAVFPMADWLSMAGWWDKLNTPGRVLLFFAQHYTAADWDSIGKAQLK